MSEAGYSRILDASMPPDRAMSARTAFHRSSTADLAIHHPQSYKRPSCSPSRSAQLWLTPELQAELEQCRIERDEWEQKALQEHVSADEARTTADALRRDLEVEREGRERAETGLEVEREKSGNLQSVLEDFQACTCCLRECYGCCSLSKSQGS